MSNDDMIRSVLSIGDAECEIQMSRVDSYDDCELTVRLSRDGFREYIRELGLSEHSVEAEAWLAGDLDE